jgi:hypothetical protein
MPSDAAGPTGPGDPIDWARVRELRQEIGPEEFEAVIALFLEETGTMVDALAGAPAEEYAERLHGLKGTALNLGLADLARLCRDGERQAAGGEAGAVPLARLLSSYHRARRALVRGLADGRAA